MSSRHLIDPELVDGLAMFPSIEFSDALLPMMRKQIKAMGASALEAAQLQADLEERRIPTAQGHEITLLIHSPRDGAQKRPGAVWIHGGGYILGAPHMMIPLNQRMAAELGVVIVAVQYRLAPDTPHPGPVEDCYAALKWLHDNADALGVDRTRIAVGGESAGGGLAAALALLARDRGEVAIAHQHLIYPMIDDRTCVREPSPNVGEFVWTLTSNRFGWRALLGQAPGSEGVSPYAAAARAEDLGGLPSTYISVGALDLFLEEDIEYARRLMRAGVPTELHVYPGAYHGFDMAADAAVTRKANQDSFAALRRALRTG